MTPDPAASEAERSKARREQMAALAARERQPTPEEVADLRQLLDAISLRQAKDRAAS